MNVLPLVGIVVLNWNKADETLACLESIRGLDYPRSFAVVVDNGSADDSVARIRSAFPATELIENGTNRGFAGGCNIGLRHAFAQDAEFAWLLNSDARTEPGTLSHLVSGVADRRIGLASPLLRGSDGTLASPGGTIDAKIGLYRAIHDLPTMRAEIAARPLQVVAMGTALLVRKSLFETIGGLDEKMFAYWEDVDYGMRCLAAGSRTHIDFEAAVFHPEKSAAQGSGAVTPHYLYYMARNEILLWRKHLPLWRQLRPLRWAYLRQRRLIRATEDRPAGADAVWAGIWDGWRGVGGAYHADRRMPGVLRRLLSAAT